MSGAHPRLITTTDLTAEQLRAVHDLVQKATESDGVPPLREQALLQMQTGSAGRSILAYDPTGTMLLGVAHVDPDVAAEGPAVEIAVHPRAGNQGVGTALLDEALALCPPPPSPVRLWAHGETAAAGQLARIRGFLRVRHLFQMRRSLSSALPSAEPREGISIRRFDPEHDVPALHDLNAAAFTALPDQGSWTQADLRMRMAEDWFDPDGLLLATSGSRLVGFLWTKVVDRAGGPSEGLLGEVYVLGVAPEARGRGLGRMLTVAGLHHLRDLGCSGALLYVDASNVPAIGLYRSLGFTVWDSDMLFRR